MDLCKGGDQWPINATHLWADISNRQQQRQAPITCPPSLQHWKPSPPTWVKYWTIELSSQQRQHDNYNMHIYSILILTPMIRSQNAVQLGSLTKFTHHTSKLHQFAKNANPLFLHALITLHCYFGSPKCWWSHTMLPWSQGTTKGGVTLKDYKPPAPSSKRAEKKQRSFVSYMHPDSSIHTALQYYCTISVWVIHMYAVRSF